MDNHDLLSYYKTMERIANLQYVSEPAGLNKNSAEETLDYFTDQRRHYGVLCKETM